MCVGGGVVALTGRLVLCLGSRLKMAKNDFRDAEICYDEITARSARQADRENGRNGAGRSCQSITNVFIQWENVM